MHKMHFFLIFVFTIILPSCFFSQTDTNYVLNFNFNNNQIIEENNKIAIKPIGVSLVDDRFGNRQSALYLHGHPLSYLNLGTTKLLKPQKGTISLWVNLDRRVYTGRGYDNNPIILTKNGPGNDFFAAYSLFYDCNSRRFAAAVHKDSTQDVIISSLDEALFNKWYHLVIAYDKNYFAFYVNGNLQQKSYKGFETKFLGTDSVIIGNAANKKNDRWSQGTIDDIQIFHRVLNEHEIKELYETPNPNREKIIIDYILKCFGLVLLFFLMAYFLMSSYRKKLKREAEKYKLNSKLYEMEIKLIKNQMNPHFIFNSLSSIQQLYDIDEKEKAQYYMEHFSRLLRKLLENTTKENVSLEDEKDILSRYLEIESLRFNHVFIYSIEIDKEINAATTFIPHFLIQPFVENAIWHGLLPKKKGDKRLSIYFKLVNKHTIMCTIDDNGVGRKNRVQNLGKKSLAINFIQQRLDLMNKNLSMDLRLTIIDKTDESGNSEGTKIILLLPIIGNSNSV